MQTSRCFFNPTGVPGLRTPRHGFHNAGTTSRVGLRGLGKGNTARWRGIRKESTDTGEDKTGHISAHANEGILFFDSQ
jgi:hypothetical protein